MSRPAVVVPLFLAVLGLILFLLFRPGPSADDLMTPARPLLASDDPADWERAWDEYLEPLSRKFPDQYADEVAATRARVDARRELRRAVEQGRLVRYRSDGERLFYHGLRLAQAGEAASSGDGIWRVVFVEGRDEVGGTGKKALIHRARQRCSGRLGVKVEK